MLPYPPFRRMPRRGDLLPLMDIGAGVDVRGRPNAGIANLPRQLTINGQTKDPTFWYNAADLASASDDWVGEYGETLTAAGSGGTVDLAVPTPELTDRAVDCAGARYWTAGNNAFAQLGSDDAVFECVFRCNETTAASSAILGKYDTAAENSGFIIYRVSTYVQLILRSGGSSVITPSAVGSLAPGVWSHLIAFADRSGSAVIYINGAAHTPAVISALGSLDIATPLLLGDSIGVSNWDNQIAYAAMWQGAAWLDTHLQATLAAERFARLNGTYSARYGVPTQALLRNSVGTTEKTHNGVQRLMQVGAYWPRIDRRFDSAYRYASGYLSEASHTNIMKQSEDFSTWWSPFNATISTDTGAAPNGEVTADTIVEDATAAAVHGVSNGSIPQTASAYTICGFVRPKNRSHLRVRIYSATDGYAGLTFDVLQGILGENESADGGGARYVGDGWYFVWMTDTRATVENMTVYLYASTGLAAANATFSGLSQDSLEVWGWQVTATAYPVSYIPTTTAAVTRLADRLQYQNVSIPKSCTLAADVLHPYIGAGVGGLIDATFDATNTPRALIYKTAANHYTFASNVTTQASFANPGAKANVWQEMRSTFADNNVEAYLDGDNSGSAGPDTSSALAATDRLSIGSYYDGSNVLNGLVRARIYSKPTLKNVTDFGDIMSYANAYISTAAAVALNASTYTNLGGTWTEIASSDFTVSAAGVFTYTGTATKRFGVSCGVSASPSAALDPLTVGVEKNGTVTASSKGGRKAPITDMGRMAVIDSVELATGDTVNIAALADSGTPNLTADYCTVMITEQS